MKASVAGHVELLGLQQKDSLVPLFEAITNALQSIDEARRLDTATEPHKVVIEIERTNADVQKKLDGTLETVGPISGFIIRDTGIGFTKDNYTSFGEAGSRHKQSIGGKGLGRFSYLAVFDHAEVESTYHQDGDTKRRRFDFAHTETGFRNHTDRTVSDSRPRETSVALKAMHPHFQKACPAKLEQIARKCCTHFFKSLVGNDVPEVFLEDPVEDTSISLNRRIRDELVLKSKNEEFEVSGHTLTITHSFVSQKALSAHSLMFCARGRAVDDVTLKLDRTVTLQSGPFTADDGTPFFYCGSISGPILDDRVNNSRTRLELPERCDEDMFESLSMSGIREAATKLIRKSLRKYTKEPRDEHFERIRRLCENHPAYRILLRHAKRDLKQIQPALTDEKLELEIIQLYNRHRLQTRERFESLRKKTQRGVRNFEKFRKEYRVFLDQHNELAVAELAQYMLDRKAALDALDNYMRVDEDGKFPVEEAIHEVIFPLSSTSDDLSYEETNLWIVDERLAFHSYLASDKRISSHNSVESSSGLEPDLAVYFDSAFALSENGSSGELSSVVIVEFKRPERDNYEPGYKKNPFDQVEEYVRQIRAGKAADRDGRTIEIRNDIPFFAYVIADLRPTLEPIAESRNAFTTHDGKGMIYYHAKLNLFVQVISYSKLLGDAKLRNKIFFEKLGIDVK